MIFRTAAQGRRWRPLIAQSLKSSVTLTGARKLKIILKNCKKIIFSNSKNWFVKIPLKQSVMVIYTKTEIYFLFFVDYR